MQWLHKVLLRLHKALLWLHKAGFTHSLACKPGRVINTAFD